MQSYHSLIALPNDLPIALTIGVFDGVHLGHQQLLSEIKARARALQGASAVLTFEPHPDEVLHPDRPRQALYSLGERQQLLAQQGIDQLLILPFDQALAQRSAEQFMTDLCHHMCLRELWIGHDFRLGYKGSGTFSVLQSLGTQLGYTVHPITATLVDGVPISSTRIRQQLIAGDVVGAAQSLGRLFSIQGPVVHGDHRGRKLGFPTANIETPPTQLLPADGVYACRVQIAEEGTWLPAVTNIGVRPTFGVLNRTVEAHLLNWDGDLYGQALRVAFVARLRGEQRFPGIEALLAQIRQDVEQAQALLTTFDAEDG